MSGLISSLLTNILLEFLVRLTRKKEKKKGMKKRNLDWKGRDKLSLLQVTWVSMQEILKNVQWCSQNSIQFSSVALSCPTLCNPMNRSMPGLLVHYRLPEFTQTHVHQVGDAIPPSHPLPSPFPPAPNPSRHRSLFQWVNPSHEVAKVLEFQL